MNPLGWRREHLAALVAFAISGGLGGLMLGWFQSPFYRISARSISGEWADMPRVFMVWLAAPALYWPWPMAGALIVGLLFYAIQLGRLPRL